MSKGFSTALARLASVLAVGLACSSSAMAWGDEGHQAVALIADHFLTPATRLKIAAILASDTAPLKMRDGRLTNASFATQATWADYYRDSQDKVAQPDLQTARWHYANIEITQGSLSQACGTAAAHVADSLASRATSEDCVLNKITQFSAALADPQTPARARLEALKFVLHFVGDVHQPLHAADDHDEGGNTKNVTAHGFASGNLHHFWDAEFVAQLGATPEAVSKKLLSHITHAQVEQWSSTNPTQWTLESFQLAKEQAYGTLPSPTAGKDKLGPTYQLDQRYVAAAIATVSLQLSRAGVRLAALLNAAMQRLPMPAGDPPLRGTQ